MLVDLVMVVLAVGWGLGASFLIATTPLRAKGERSASPRAVAARGLDAEQRSQRARPLTESIAGSRSWYRAQRERGGIVNAPGVLSR